VSRRTHLTTPAQNTNTQHVRDVPLDFLIMIHGISQSLDSRFLLYQQLAVMSLCHELLMFAHKLLGESLLLRHLRRGDKDTQRNNETSEIRRLCMCASTQEHLTSSAARCRTGSNAPKAPAITASCVVPPASKLLVTPPSCANGNEQ